MYGCGDESRAKSGYDGGMIEQLRRFRLAEAFEPYVVRLKDGRVIPVFRPMAVGGSEEGGPGSGFLSNDGIAMYKLKDVEAVQAFEEAVA